MAPREAWEQMFRQEGLLFLGLVDLHPEPEFPRFQEWLGEGRHGDMYFLEQHQSLRADPRGLIPDGKQALIFAMPYYQGDRLQAARQGAYAVAQYARLRDYHRTMKQKGESILACLKRQIPDLSGRVTIDSAPILERALAARTKRGFIGKNTLFIHPQFGSFLLLGEILLTQIVAEADVPLSVSPGDRSEAGGCGTCRRCQVHCPTGALDQDYRIDARRCLAYWTIEHRGPVPLRFWPWFRVYMFGCDLCQLACPYNRSSPRATMNVREDLKRLDLFDVATMSQARYEELFGGTPLTRAKRAGLRRNALIALTVTADSRLPQALAAIDPDDPEVLHATFHQIQGWQMTRSDADRVTRDEERP